MKIICLLTEKDATLFYKKVALLNQQNDIIVLKSLKEIFRCNFKKAKTEFYQIVTYSHILNSALLYRLNNKLDYYSICLYDYYIPEHLMKNNMGIDVSFIDAIKGTNITEQDLIQPNSNLIIRAHGEGTHLNLNNIVLCSCSNIKECRKAYLKKPVAFSNIRANNVVLFTCNGIVLNHELHSYEESIIRELVVSHSNRKIITTYTPIKVTLDLIELAKKCISFELDYEFITRILNEAYYLKYGYKPFICISTSVLNREFINTSLKRIETIFTKKFTEQETLTGKKIVFLYLLLSGSLKRLKESPYTKYEKRKNTILLATAKEIIKTDENIVANIKFISFLEKLILLSSDTDIILKKETLSKLKEKMTLNKYKLMSLKNEGVIFTADFENLKKKVIMINSIFFKTKILLLKNFGKNHCIERYAHLNFSVNFFEKSKKKCNYCSNLIFKYEMIEHTKLVYYFCPVCGIDSIGYYFHPTNNALHISRRIFVERNILHVDFFVPIIKNASSVLKEKYVIFEFYDKSKNNLFYRKEERNKIEQTVLKYELDISTLNPDLHSYKILIISEFYLIFSHGKYQLRREEA